jgi:hypothetical protein
MTATSFRIAKDGLGNDGSDHGFIIATKVAILKTATVVLGTSTSAAITAVQCTYFDGGGGDIAERHLVASSFLACQR